MKFSMLTATVIETGEQFVLFDGKNFQNFDRLACLVEDDDKYINLNDDLMDGPDPRTWGDDVMHPVWYKWEFGECTMTIQFEYSTEKVYVIEDEAANRMEAYVWYADALEQVKAYEAEDKADGSYSDGFYYIRDTRSGECEHIFN